MKQREPRVLVCLLLCVTSATASTGFVPSSTGWLESILKLAIFQSPLPASIPEAGPLLPIVPPPCAVEPIPALDDEEAATFEAAAGVADVVDRTGLTPATRIALTRFERRIASLGGEIAVTSAYRPPAYQAHLQVVWDRWMQLRSNYDANCAVIRAQAEDEFTHHRLLVSQRPVPVSDHTLGTAFDAAIRLRRGLPIDRIARSSGVVRPDIIRDPVHFRLIAAIR